MSRVFPARNDWPHTTEPAAADCEPAGAAEASVVLLEGGVDAEGDGEAAKGLVSPPPDFACLPWV